MKHLIIVFIAIFSSLNLSAIEFKGRVGYNLGGTMPLPVPAEIRQINSYNPRFGVSLGAETLLPFANNNRWGLNVGLKVVNLKMSTTARVKNYSAILTMGMDKIEGRFTGTSEIHADFTYLNLPVQVEYSLSEHWKIRAGAYLGIKLKTDFHGAVYDGYQRKGNPTGERIDITTENKAHYDFSHETRRINSGVIIGIDHWLSSRWAVYGEANWGITNIFRKEFTAVSFPLYQIHGTFGLAYRL